MTQINRIFLIALFAIPSIAGAQSVSLLTFGGYSFEDKFYTSNDYEGKIYDGFQWGAGLEFAPFKTQAFEFVYQRLDTDGYIKYPLTTDRGAVGINYIMLGGTRYAPFNERISGFGTLDLGLAVLSTKDNTSDGNAEKFAWGVRLGTQVAASDKISFRLYGQVMSAVQALGGAFYFGTGGFGAGGSGFSTFYQFNLGGSLNYRIH